MEIKFASSHRRFENVRSALLLGALLANACAALDWLPLLLFALVGVIVPLIPRAGHRKAQAVLWGLLAAWLLIRFLPILDGSRMLANRMFERSALSQSYVYDYFTVSGHSAAEAVLWLSLLSGALCARWGNRFLAALCGLWMLAMAYFGVTPGALWLAALLLTGLLAAIPGQQRWLYGLMVGILVAGIALAVTRIAPEPNKAVSAVDDRLRDVLAAVSVTYEQTPVPTEVPQPEIVPQWSTQLQQPDHGVQKAAVNMLFILLASLTLALLFIPAVLKDRAEKKREQARAGLDDPDHGTAIRAMYLYARKWGTLSDAPAEIPAEVYAIWQEAAFSDHAMNETQREIMRGYLKETAEKIWLAADWKKRLHIRYRIGL